MPPMATIAPRWTEGRSAYPWFRCPWAGRPTGLDLWTGLRGCASGGGLRLADIADHRPSVGVVIARRALGPQQTRWRRPQKMTLCARSRTEGSPNPGWAHPFGHCGSRLEPEWATARSRRRPLDGSILWLGHDCP